MTFIHRYHSNVKHSLRLSSWSFWKNFNFIQTWRYNTKHEPNKKNMRLKLFVFSRSDFKGYEDAAMVFCVFISFLFRTNGKRTTG